MALSGTVGDLCTTTNKIVGIRIGQQEWQSAYKDVRALIDHALDDLTDPTVTVALDASVARLRTTVPASPVTTAHNRTVADRLEAEAEAVLTFHRQLLASWDSRNETTPDANTSDGSGSKLHPWKKAVQMVEVLLTTLLDILVLPPWLRSHLVVARDTLRLASR